MDKGLRQREQSYDEGWDERQALHHWAEIAGQTAMDLDLFNFLVREIGLRERDVALRWQGMLARLISAMLRAGMPMELLLPRPNYQAEDRMARNAEEAFLVALNACAQATSEVSTIDWPLSEDSTDSGTTSAGAWITRLRGQRSSPANRLALHCLSFLDLSFCVLHLIDLFKAVLHSTVMANVKAEVAILRGAKLTRVDLNHAILTGMDVSRADLTFANLNEATMDLAILAGANLTHATLTHATLTGTNLTGANLTGADLTNADLTNANLTDTDLTGARFSSRAALASTRGKFRGTPIFLDELVPDREAHPKPTGKRRPSLKARDSRRG